MLLYRFIPKIGILSTWGCFLALFGPSRGEKGQKKVNRQTPDKKNYPQKKLQIPGYFAEKNQGCTIISHRATFVYFWTFFLSPHGIILTEYSLSTAVIVSRIYIFFLCFFSTRAPEGKLFWDIILGFTYNFNWVWPDVAQRLLCLDYIYILCVLLFNNCPAGEIFLSIISELLTR